MFKLHTFNIDKKWLDLIKSGEKKSEIRKYYLPLEIINEFFFLVPA